MLEPNNKTIHTILQPPKEVKLSCQVPGGFAATSILIASFMKTRERFMGIGQAITMPLFFASNALYPLQIMPSILREFSAYNPLSYVVDAVRGLLITGNLSNILIDLTAIAIFDITMFILASVSLRRIIE